MAGNAPRTADQSQFNARLILLLETRKIDYAIGGSVAAMAYSETRNTIDIDVMIAVVDAQLSQLIDDIESWNVYVDPFETVLEFKLARALPVSVVDGVANTKADLYVARSTGLDVSAMGRRRRMRFDEALRLDAWFLSPEDVILYKLDYFKQSEGVSIKHPGDIAKLLMVMGDQLDRTYLSDWAERLNIETLWQALWDEYKK